MISILIFLCLKLVEVFSLPGHQHASLECSEEDSHEFRPTYLVEESKEDWMNPNFDHASCFLKKDTGHCNKYRQRWYYSPGCGTCKPFWYGGCAGNANNFVSFDFCYIRCHLEREPDAGIDEPDESEECSQERSDAFRPTYLVEESKEDVWDPHFEPGYCYLTKDTGHCNKYRQRWYYSPSCGTCKTFWYGGCAGNENNFLSYNTCIGQCRFVPKLGSRKK